MLQIVEVPLWVAIVALVAIFWLTGLSLYLATSFKRYRTRLQNFIEPSTNTKPDKGDDNGNPIKGGSRYENVK
jgi:hypothetical protein